MSAWERRHFCHATMAEMERVRRCQKVHHPTCGLPARLRCRCDRQPYRRRVSVRPWTTRETLDQKQVSPGLRPFPMSVRLEARQTVRQDWCESPPLMRCCQNGHSQRLSAGHRRLMWDWLRSSHLFGFFHRSNYEYISKVHSSDHEFLYQSDRVNQWRKVSFVCPGHELSGQQRFLSTLRFHDQHVRNNDD